MDKINSSEEVVTGLKPEIKLAIDAWEERGTIPGDFLTAVLKNDLTQAIHRADDENLRSLPAIVKYLYWEVAGNCWGSPEKVRDWELAKERQRRSQKKAQCSAAEVDDAPGK